MGKNRKQPFGYKMVKGRVEIDNGESTWVQYLYREYNKEESFRLLHQNMIDYNCEAKARLIKEPEVADFLAANPDYKFKSLLSLAIDAGGDELAGRMLKGQKILDSLPKADLEVVLNKCQQIYPELENAK